MDRDERLIAWLMLWADRFQTDRLLAWAEPLDADRLWAIESASGLGHLLAQELVAAGEQVIDVAPTLSARVRLSGSSTTSKNDANGALSTAIAGLRHCGLRGVGRDDHTAILRLLTDRHHDLTGLRTQAACRLHTTFRELTAGGAPLRLSAAQRRELLDTITAHDPVVVERKRHAHDHLADITRLDHEIDALKTRITDAVAASSCNGSLTGSAADSDSTTPCAL